MPIRMPRLTIRRLMIAVAVVALGLWGVRLYRVRSYGLQAVADLTSSLPYAEQWAAQCRRQLDRATGAAPMPNGAPMMMRQTDLDLDHAADELIRSDPVVGDWRKTDARYLEKERWLAELRRDHIKADQQVLYMRERAKFWQYHPDRPWLPVPREPSPPK